jgi:branched-chain amino acid aminotransferase
MPKDCPMPTHVSTWKLSFNDAARKLNEIRLAPIPKTLNNASLLLPEGVYTTFRTYNGGKILPLEDQIRRLEESALLLDQPVTLNKDEIQAALRCAYHSMPAGEVRVRLTVDLSEKPGTVFLSLEQLQTPTREDYEQGVRVATCPYHRENPRAKRTTFISIGENLRRELPADAYECLMVDEDCRILEGLSSNFFAWRQDQLWTAGSGVLAGISRAQTLEAARTLGLPIRLESAPLSAASEFQEAFITSSSRAILPVRQIDDVLIGSGEPGPVTRRLMQRYWENIRKKLVEL